MKKIISLVLAAVLALSVCIPAAAAKSGGETPEDSQSGYADDSVPFDDWLAVFKTQHADIYAAALKDGPPLWQAEGFGSKQEMLDAYGMTDDEYTEYLLNDRLSDYYDEYLEDCRRQSEAKWVGDTRESLGGTRAGLAVMLDGRYIAFPDAQPQLRDGRTMVPLRALLEAMGASVDYSSDGTVTAKLADRTLSFRTGDKTILAVSGGKTESIDMDCAGFVENGRTYVPVRFAAQAAGCDVYWDEEFQTAVVVDGPALVQIIDKDFSVVNRVFALKKAASAPGQSQKTAADFTARFTAFDTLDGDTTGTVSGNVTLVRDGHAYRVTAGIDLKAVMALIAKSAGAGEVTPQEIAAFSNISADVIVDLDKGLMYVKCPAVIAAEYGAKYAYDWIQYEADPADFTDMLSGYDDLTGALMAGAGSMGALLYADGVSDAAYSNPVFLYSGVLSDAADAKKMIGDGCFTKSGDAYTLSMDRNKYEMIAHGSLPESESDYDYKELEGQLKISGGSDVSVSGSFRVRENGYDSASPLFGYGGNDTRYSGSFTLSAGDLSLQFTMHVQNTVKLELSLTAHTSSYDVPVLTAPPAGSTVVSSDDLSESSYIDDSAA